MLNIMSFDGQLLEPVLDVLSGGPRTLDEIIQALSEAGQVSDSDEDELEELFSVIHNSDLIWESDMGLCSRTDQVLDKVYLTHRLSQREIDKGLVDVIPDLDGLDLGMEDTVLASGGRLKDVYPQTADDCLDETDDTYSDISYSGPPGWLNAFSAGDLIAFHRVGETIEVLAPDPLGNGESEKAALAETYDSLYASIGNLGIESIELLLDTLCVTPALFREPVAPLQELLSDIGIEIDGSFLGPGTREKELSLENKMVEALSGLIEEYELEPCCIHEFLAVSRALNAWGAGDLVQIDPVAIAKGLSHGAVAQALVSWVFGHDLMPTSVVGEFATQVLESKRAPLAAVYFLRSIARSLEGKALLAEEDIRKSLLCDSEYEPAKLEWAIYAADRGDISTNISRLKRCESEIAESVARATENFLPKYPPTERNAPCPCGSGRKYKACCLLSPKLTSTSALKWLLNRVIDWLARPEQNSRFIEYFAFIEQLMDEHEAEDHTPLILDAVLFEGGGFKQYLETKSELLCEPDKELLESLTSSKRALFEVTGVTSGESLTVRNMLSGETVTVTEKLISLDCEVGEYLLGRVFNFWGGPAWFGPGIKVDLMKRQRILDLLQSEYDAFEYLSWMAEVLQPFALGIGEEHLVFCQAWLRPVEDIDLNDVLREAFEESSESRWRQRSSTGEAISDVFVRYQDGLLILDTYSVEKLDHLLETLEDLLDGFEIVERSEFQVEPVIKSLIEDFGEDGNDKAAARNDAIDSFIDELENKWLGKPLQVLCGRTPREAVSDPNTKEDLLRLLSEIERDNKRSVSLPGNPQGGLQASRIRAKLNL